MSPDPRPGPTCLDDGRCRFQVWAPLADRVEVRFPDLDRNVPMARGDRGWHRADVPGVRPGDLYLYRLDGRLDRPDPASRGQPRGVHGPSSVPDAAPFPWTDGAWRGLPLSAAVFYEIHVGTYGDGGTFDAVARHLDVLRDLGVTAVELMPVAAFPGSRNWGYDGVFPFCVHGAYGGPDGLKRLVDACHARGLAAVMDVVCNHLGPEGNYLADFGPYFQDDVRTPWGRAVNFDRAGSDGVRAFFLANVRLWIEEFHFDGLRFDAIHGIVDTSAGPFLAEAAAETRAAGARAGRTTWAVAESDGNDPRVLRPPELGGLGFDAQWSDDLHHALHALLTGERSGYYADFGRLDDLVRALRDGFAYDGRWSAWRNRRHGAPATDIAPGRLVVCAQNHDQVGNRARGERLAALVPPEALRLAAATVGLSANLPLLFMGEEWGEPAPFLYFVSHGDAALLRAVREGRRTELATFPRSGEIPDPGDPATFERSRVHPGLQREGRHAALWRFHREVLRLRREHPALAAADRPRAVRADEASRCVVVERGRDVTGLVLLLHFDGAPATLDGALPPGRWRRVLDSADPRWDGPGSPAAEPVDAPAAVRIGPWQAVAWEREP